MTEFENDNLKNLIVFVLFVFFFTYFSLLMQTEILSRRRRPRLS